MKTSTSENFGVQPRVKTTPQDSQAVFLPSLKVSPERLPSQGILYPEDLEISYKPYMYGEVKKANQSKFSTKETFEFMLSGVTITGMDPLELTVPDALYIGLLRKISTLGTTKFQVPWVCPSCGKRNSHVMNSNEMEFEDLLIDALPEVEMDDGSVIEMSPLTLKNYFMILSRKLESDELALFAAEVKNLPFDKAYEKFKSVSFEEGVLLEEADKLMYHDLKPVTSYCKNESCKFEMKIELDGGETLLLPFREHPGDAKNRIHFGAKIKSRRI